jgi:hypothetical protein
LQQKAAVLSKETIESGGHVPDDKLAELKQLEQLVQINKSTEAAPIRSRWPVITLLAVTLIIVSILLFARVSSTEIELDLLVSEVSFRVPEQQALTNDINLSSLGVSGIQEIQMPRSQTKEEQMFQAQDETGLAVKLTPKTVDEHDGSLTLAAIIVSAASRIDLTPADNSQQFRLSIKGKGMELSAGVNGTFEIAQAGMPPEQVRYTSPKSVIFKSTAGEINLDMSLMTGIKEIFSIQIPADSLWLFNVDEHIGRDNTIVRHLSTVLSGTIYFESLGGKEKKLRPGQEIRFESSKGIIRTLDLKDDHVAFGFHGSVAGMTTGDDNNPVCLMPTYLEWLSARHGLSLLWGTTLYLFGIILGVIRWWRTSP